MQTQTSTAGDTVRAAMRGRNVSQYKLATHLGLSQTAISRRLADDVEFSISEIRAASALLDTDFSHLVTPAEAPQSSTVAVDSTDPTHAGVVPRPSVPSGAEDATANASSALPNPAAAA